MLPQIRKDRSAENAAGFAYHVDEYLLDPRFHDMYAAGRSSAVHRQYDDETPSGIVEAMDDWSRPPSAAAAMTGATDGGMVTVMLTRVMAIHPDGRGQARKEALQGPLEACRNLSMWQIAGALEDSGD